MSQQPNLAPTPSPPPPRKDGADPTQRMSVCVFTNRSFPFKTILAYADKYYAETWLAEKQKNGIRLPHPYVLQYEIVFWKDDWKNIAADIDRLLAKYEVPADIGGKNHIAWLKKRKWFVIRRLKKIVGRRRIRQQYFNHARNERLNLWVCVMTVILVVGLAWKFGVFQAA